MKSLPAFVRWPRALAATIRQRLAWKLGVVVAVMGGMLLLTATVAILALLLVRGAEERRAQAEHRAQIAFQLRSTVQAYTAALLDMAWTRTDRQDELDMQTQRFQQQLALANASTQGIEQRSLLDDLAQQEAEYRQFGAGIVVETLRANESQAAVLWLTGQTMANRAYDLADKYYQLESQQAVLAAEQARVNGQRAIIILVMSVIVALSLGIGITTLLSRKVVSALIELAGAAQRFAAGDTSPVVVDTDDELGTLAHAFNAMAADLTAQRHAQQSWSEQLEQRVKDRTDDLRLALQQQQQLSDTIRQMSTPVLPVLDDVLVMPMVGSLDAERILQAQTTLLQAIERQGSRVAIIDITGIPLVDHAVAQSLVMMLQQARLLGAKGIVVGISPQVAQALVAVQATLGDLHTAIDLRSALRGVLEEQQRRQRLPERAPLRIAA